MRTSEASTIFFTSFKEMKQQCLGWEKGALSLTRVKEAEKLHITRCYSTGSFFPSESNS